MGRTPKRTYSVALEARLHDLFGSSPESGSPTLSLLASPLVTPKRTPVPALISPLPATPPPTTPGKTLPEKIRPLFGGGTMPIAPAELHLELPTLPPAPEPFEIPYPLWVLRPFNNPTRRMRFRFPTTDGGHRWVSLPPRPSGSAEDLGITPIKPGSLENP